GIRRGHCAIRAANGHCPVSVHDKGAGDRGTRADCAGRGYPHRPGCRAAGRRSSDRRHQAGPAAKYTGHRPRAVGQIWRTEMTAIQVIGILSALVTLLNKMGVNVHDVSEKVLQAHDEGRTLSDAELRALAQDWQETDAAEQAAYDKRMNRPKA